MKLLSLLVCCIVLSSLSFSQGYSSGAAYYLSKEDTKDILSELDKDSIKWADIMSKVFGKTHDKSLADVVVYIDKEESVKVALIYDGKKCDDLRGEKYVWAVVITRHNFNTKADTIKKRDGKDAFRAKREALQYQQEPGEMTIAGLLSWISGSTVSAQKSGTGIVDTEEVISLELVGVDGSDSLYLGWKKFSLALNTLNRVAIYPIGNTNAIRHINHNFGNFGKSQFGGSIGLGVTTGGRPDTSFARVKFYIYGQLYLRRPSLPKSDCTWSVVAGTNLLTEKVLSDVIFGIRGSGVEWLGQIGLVVGVNFVGVTERTFTLKKTRGFVSLDYGL